MGKAIEDMLVGCLWQGNTFLTVALSGFISLFDANNPTSPKKVIKVGHARAPLYRSSVLHALAGLQAHD